MKTQVFYNPSHAHYCSRSNVPGSTISLAKTLFSIAIAYVMFVAPCTLHAQTICSPAPNPCIEQTGPIFPGGETLCERHDDFSVDITIPNNQLASNLLSTTFNSKDIIIQGTFYIDVPTSFYYCRVRINPGGKIIVTSEAFRNDMLSFHSDFYSCSDMWEGIILETGTRCRFYYSEIEDAQYALTVHEASYMALFRNTFNRNFIGIRNYPGNHTMPFLLFSKNLFTWTSELSDPYDLEYDFDFYDKVTFAGIFLDNCSSSIGFYGSNNVFKYLNYGIVVQNHSTANIKGCVFENAQELTVIPPIIEGAFNNYGAGVLGLKSDVIITGDESNTSCAFKSADLKVEESNLLLTYATFLDCQASGRGGKSGQTQHVEYNTFNGVHDIAAVGFIRSASVGQEAHTIIRNNSFSNNADIDRKLFAVHLDGIYDPVDIALVDDNTISFEGPCIHAAIRHTVANSENAKIRNNQIAFNLENVDWEGTGIFNFAGITKGMDVSANSINGLEYEGGDPTYGIRAEHVRGHTNLNGIKYCNNSTNNLSYGLSFFGNCSHSSLFSNDIDQHYVGLTINNSSAHLGMIGRQTRHLNEWLDESDNYDFRAATHSSTASPFFSLFLVRPEDASQEKFFPDDAKLIPSTGWFVTESGDNEFCSGLEPSGELAQLDSLIIESDIAFDTLGPPVKFYFKKSLINILLQDASLSTAWSDFLDNEKSSVEYQLAQAEVDLKKAFALELADQEDVDSLYNVITSTYERIEAYDSYNYSNIDSITFVVGTGLDSIEAILDSCNVNSESKQVVIYNNEAVLETDLEGVLDALDGIVTNTA